MFLVISPKMCELSLATREKNLFHYNSGLSYQEIGKKLNLNFSRVRYIMKKKKETRSTINEPRTGCSRKLDTQAKESYHKELAVGVALTSGTIVTPQKLEILELKYSKKSCLKLINK